MVAPDAYVEHNVIIRWVVGDSLVIDPGGLQDWEVRMVLDQAVDLMSTDDESAEADQEGVE